MDFFRSHVEKRSFVKEKLSNLMYKECEVNIEELNVLGKAYPKHNIIYRETSGERNGFLVGDNNFFFKIKPLGVPTPPHLENCLNTKESTIMVSEYYPGTDSLTLEMQGMLPSFVNDQVISIVQNRKKVRNKTTGKLVREFCKHYDYDVNTMMKHVLTYPSVPQHGDFQPANILVDKETIHPIDWDCYDFTDMPLFDLLYYFISLGLVTDYQNEPDTIREAAVKGKCELEKYMNQASDVTKEIMGRALCDDDIITFLMLILLRSQMFPEKNAAPWRRCWIAILDSYIKK